MPQSRQHGDEGPKLLRLVRRLPPDPRAILSAHCYAGRHLTTLNNLCLQRFHFQCRLWRKQALRIDFSAAEKFPLSPLGIKSDRLLTTLLGLFALCISGTSRTGRVNFPASYDCHADIVSPILIFVWYSIVLFGDKTTQTSKPSLMGYSRHKVSI